MPTISEIIAAKAGGKRPTMTDVTEAINAIDPPGKDERSAKAKRLVGLVLSKNDTVPPKGEPRGQATPIGGPEQRALAATEGELINLCPVDATQEQDAWHAAMTALEADLCVMRDPKDPEACWLALTSTTEGSAPLLLHRLPWLLYDAPGTEEEPF